MSVEKSDEIVFCYLCKDALSKENETNEHILLNSIGGKLKSKKLICGKCNSESGGDYDAALSKQLHPLACMLNIKRDRNKTQGLKRLKSESGELYDLLDGMTPSLSRPKYKEEVKDNVKKIEITAANESQMMAILKGLKNKFPDFDLKKAKPKVKITEEYMEESITIPLEIGGDKSFKSIAKTAANAFVHFVGNPIHVERIVGYLKGNVKDTFVYHYCNEEDLYDMSSDNVFHIIHIKSDEINRILYCYIELFSVYSFIVKLDTDYSGKEVNISYVFDVIKREEVPQEILIKPDWKVIDQAINWSTVTKRRLSRVMGIIDKRQLDAIQSRIITSEINKSFGSLEDGALLTEDVLENFIRNVVEKMAPFIIHLENRNKKEYRS